MLDLILMRCNPTTGKGEIHFCMVLQEGQNNSQII